MQIEMPQKTLELRKAFSLFPTGVVAMCGLHDAEPVGMAVNSFSSVSLDPPLVSVCVARMSSTWPKLNVLPRIGLSVLGAGQQALSRQLSSRTGERFRDCEFDATAEGAIFIKGASLWLDCTISHRLEGGDHEIILFEVIETHLFTNIAPLVFHQSQYLALAGGA